MHIEGHVLFIVEVLVHEPLVLVNSKVSLKQESECLVHAVHVHLLPLQGISDSLIV